jgi:hypothetical protein
MVTTTMVLIVHCAIEDLGTVVEWTRPLFARLMVAHFMLLPVRLGAEDPQFSAKSAKPKSILARRRNI